MKFQLKKINRRTGTAAVELAVCLPLLLVILSGLWEVGRMVQAQQIIANAAREGGRRAAAGVVDDATIKQYVATYMTVNGLTGVTASNVTLTNLTSSSRNNPKNALQLDQYRITVTVPYSSIRWSSISQITSTNTLTVASDWYSMKDSPITVSTDIPKS